MQCPNGVIDGNILRAPSLLMAGHHCYAWLSLSPCRLLPQAEKLAAVANQCDSISQFKRDGEQT